MIERYKTIHLYIYSLDEVTKTGKHPVCTILLKLVCVYIIGKVLYSLQWQLNEGYLLRNIPPNGRP